MSRRMSLGPETNIQLLFDRDPERVTAAFRELGLKCFDCVAAGIETLRDAARYHDTSLENILKVLEKLELTEP